MLYAIVNKEGNFLKISPYKQALLEFEPFANFANPHEYILQLNDNSIGIRGKKTILDSSQITIKEYAGLKEKIENEELFIVPHPFYRVVGLEFGCEIIEDLKADADDPERFTLGRMFFDTCAEIEQETNDGDFDGDFEELVI